jgi:DNA modification methylase
MLIAPTRTDLGWWFPESPVQAIPSSQADQLSSFMTLGKTKPRPRKRRAMSSAVLETAPQPMLEVTQADYVRFRATHGSVGIESVELGLRGPYTIDSIGPPAEYKPERTTVWSFPDRGDWATHSGNYRGNWSPYIPRNLLLRYSAPGELVLDPMVGSGTTLTECRLLHRRGIGVDINRDAIMVTRDRLNFALGSLDPDHVEPEIRTYVGDARDLDEIHSDSVDLLATHPPYASIVAYSGDRIAGDLSRIRSVSEFVDQMRATAGEFFRVVRPGRHCAILMGDTRRHRHFVPISVRVMQSFLEAGFVLREDITKVQWKMKSTRESWSGSKYDFLLLAHEHLYVFRKPAHGESASVFRESSKWW